MSKFVKFIKDHKKMIAIIGGVVVVAGVSIGVICATSNSEEKKTSERKTTVATSTVEKDDVKEKEVYKKEESNLEKAQTEIKDSINQDYFAKEDGLKVYSKKDEDSKVLKTLKYNESILVYGKTEDNWYVVDVDGEPGYISNEKDTLSAYDIEAKKKADEEAQQAQANNYSSQSSNGNSSSSTGASSSSSNQSQGTSSNSQSSGTSSSQSTYPVGYLSTQTQQLNSALEGAYCCQNVGGTFYNLLVGYVNGGSVPKGVVEDIMRTKGTVSKKTCTYQYKDSYNMNDINACSIGSGWGTMDGGDGGYTNYMTAYSNGDGTVTFTWYHLDVEFTEV